MLIRITFLLAIVAFSASVFAGYSFRGKWITDDEMATLDPKPVLARQLERNKLPPANARYRNRHILFRRQVDIPVFKSAKVYITADDYYRLYVNGTFVGMGPAAGTTDCTYFNEIDVSKFLREGSNVIAVHTYYQGLVNRVWVSGDNRHGLIMDMVVDGKCVLASDENFRIARHRSYSAMGIVGYDTQFMERYDAGAPEVGFEANEFDDSTWSKAKIHPHGSDYNLVPQPTHMVETELIRPISVKKVGKSFRVDFGGIYVGGITFAATGKKGSKVKILAGQELADDGSVRHKMRCCCNYVEEMVLSGKNRDVLCQYDYKSFRHIELIPDDGVQIDTDSIILEARHQPFELKAKRKFTDQRFEPIWKLCIDTFHYGVQEQIMDCMDREKGYYLGDGCYTALAYCVLTGDWTSAQKFFDDFLRTKKVDRGLITCANCAFMQEIAEYPLMMILFAKWYLDLTGDVEFIKDRYDAFADIMDSYRERYARNDGLLVNLDKWCVVEWPKNFQDGYDADVREGKICTDMHNVINAWYIGAMKCMNSMAARIGKSQYADTDALSRSFRKSFWDADSSLFVDREGSRHVSLPGNVYAMFFGLASEGDPRSHKAFLDLVRAKSYSSISLFQFFPLFCYLESKGEHELLEELILSPDAWLRNIRENGTRTFEGWGRDTKWNTSLFHLTIASVVVFLCDMPQLELPW